MTEMHRERHDDGVAHSLASGKSWRQKRIIPNVPTLSSTPTRSVAVAGEDSVAASGSHVWNGTIGALTAKAKKKPTKSSRSVVGSSVETGEALDEEAVGAARALQVEGDDGDEHDEPAGQREEQELHRGVLPARTAEATDEEVDRDEHGLEEDVEEEHVGGGEHPDHERLEHEDAARSRS